MPRPGDHVGRPSVAQDANDQQLFNARILNTPATKADDVFVEIQEFDGGQHRFPVIWRPVIFIAAEKPKELLPSKGDFCLVAKPSTTGHVWLIDWS